MHALYSTSILCLTTPKLLTIDSFFVDVRCLVFHLFFTCFVQVDAEFFSRHRECWNYKSDKTTLDIRCATVKVVGETADGKRHVSLGTGCPFRAKWLPCKDDTECWRCTILDLNHSCTGPNVRQRQIGQVRILGASATVASYVPHTGVGKGAGRSDSVQLVEQVQKTEGITLRYGQAFSIVNKLAHYPITAPWTEVRQLESYFGAWKQFDPNGCFEAEYIIDREGVRRIEVAYFCPSSWLQYSASCRGNSSSGLLMSLCFDFFVNLLIFNFVRWCAFVLSSWWCLFGSS